MATLYDDQDDPLDGFIAALQGIGQGVGLHQQGRMQGHQLRRQQGQDRALEEERRQRLWLASRQLAMHEEQQAALEAERQRQISQSQSDATGLGQVLQGRFGGGQPGQQGPMPGGDTVDTTGGSGDPEVQAAFRGLKPMLGQMSPQAVQYAGESLRQHALDRSLGTSRDDLLSEIQALAAPMNPDGTPGEAPTDSMQMLGGFVDPTEVQSLAREAKAAKTPYQLARVEDRIRGLQEKQKREVLIGEFKANARSELDPLFAEADMMNSERVKAGLPSMARDIFAARSQMADLFRPGRRMTEDQLFGEVDQIRQRLTRLRLGDTSDGSSSNSRKAPEAEKGSAAYYEFISRNPMAYRAHIVDEAKSLFDTGIERTEFIDREMAKFEAQQADAQHNEAYAPGRRKAIQGLPFNETMPFGGDPGTQSPVVTDAAIKDHYARTKEWVKAQRVPFDVAKAALSAASRGEDPRPALKAALEQHNAEEERAVEDQFSDKHDRSRDREFLQTGGIVNPR